MSSCLTWTSLVHEVEGQLSGELDETIIPRLCNDHNALYIGSHSRPPYQDSEGD